MAINRGNPKNISIHHSAVQPPATNMAMLKQRAAAHNNHHKANSIAWNNTTPGEYGYRWIRYHYMIAQDGSVLQTQDLKYALYANGDGTGARSFNMTSVAIMFEGNYEIAKPTDAMMLALVKLIREIEKKYKINPMVRGHKELGAATACPGKNIGTSASGWLKQVIANVNDKNYPKPEDWRTEAKKLKEKTTYITTKDTALFEIDTGKRVTEFKKGTKIDVDYEMGNWLLTAWSYDRKIKNGFKRADLDTYDPTPPPDPCKKQKDEITRLKDKLGSKNDLIKLISDSLRDKEQEVTKLKKELEDARSSEDFAYGEVKKVKSKLESANLNISTLNDIIKNLEEDILLFETKLGDITKKITELLGIRSKYELEKEKNRKLQEKLDRGIERLTLGELIRGILHKLRV